MKKFVCIMTLVVIAVIIGGMSLNMFHNSKKGLERIEYRTDIQPLNERFSKTLDISDCFWKVSTIGNTRFGPSSYWMKGYAFISQETAESIKAEYSFVDVNINFEKGITPDVTKKNEFRWSYNKKLSREIAGTKFIGEVYFDTLNNIIYFDLESK